ncbi:MAG: hypothetical protein IJS71_09805 [Clostridia bacterium]|nr:hypothetical protein [Clostridia bacterium]
MKKIILVFKIIANFFRSKKLIASVFVCAALLFGVSFLSVLGAFTSYFADVDSEDYLKCSHVVSFAEEQTLTGVNEYTGNRFYRNRRYTELNSQAAGADGSTYRVTTYYGETDELLYYVCRDGRLTFTKDEMSGEVPAVFVSNDLCKEAGETITLPFWDCEFRVAGIVDDPIGRLIVVPMVWFEKADLKVNHMTFYTSRKLSVFEEKKLEYDLCSDGRARLTGGMTYDEAVQNSSVDLIGSGILAVIVLVLGFYLFNYTSQKNSRTYSLLGILGSSKANTIFLLMLERILTTFAIMTVSAVIHFAVRDLLHGFLMIPECRMGLKEYAVAVGIIVLASVFSSIPFAVYYVKNSYTTVVKHYE